MLPRWCLPRSSPHTRGCFLIILLFLQIIPVFPAYAGVFLVEDYERQVADCLPRIRGGVSGAIVYGAADIKSSPHTRGCFQPLELFYPQCVVFPAYAGVFPIPPGLLRSYRSLPRIRGGVSVVCSIGFGTFWSSPHTRGCFYFVYAREWVWAVFPAYAGVFPEE